MVLALFAFIVYYNLMTLGQSWVGSGRMGLVPFMALLHGGTLEQACFCWRYGTTNGRPAAFGHKGAPEYPAPPDSPRSRVRGCVCHDGLSGPVLFLRFGR